MHISPRPAVFLDRDGTINVEVNYLHRPEDLRLIDGVPAAIRRLNQAGLPVIVVTNQAGIARGLYDEAALHALHAYLNGQLVEHGAHIDAFCFCPHHPDFTGACACRKPGAAMLTSAAAELGLDLANSWLIGDTEGDIGAGKAAGCRTILVRTGYGARTEARLRDMEAAWWPDAIVDALPAAVEHVLRAASVEQGGN